MRNVLLILLLSFLITGCTENPSKDQQPILVTGPWHLELDLDTTAATLPLPVQFDLSQNNGKWMLDIHNQRETIIVDSVTLRGDSILIRMPLFDSEFKGVIHDPRTFSGVWNNYYKGPGYAIPFIATAGDRPRFPTNGSLSVPDLSGDWETHFISSEGNEPAIGLFSMNGSKVTGTFATETGDYRFLEGVVTADSLYLSTFNGSQAYLFEARLRPDSMIGTFYSGHRSKQTWYAVRDTNFALRDDESLTSLDPTQPVDFDLPDLTGSMHSLQDEKYKDKVVIIQVMGTWCPNCIDESRMLNEFFIKYHEEGLEIVGLAFERHSTWASSTKAIKQFREHTGISYDILYAGAANKDTVLKKLPFLANFMSYPTTVLVDRNGKVRSIFTGIYGPGTGERYIHFKRRMEDHLLDLLHMPVND